MIRRTVLTVACAIIPSALAREVAGASCRDGIVVPPEQCDEGVVNGSPTSCCSAICQFVSTGTVCRPAADTCDHVEICTGTSATCPPQHARDGRDRVPGSGRAVRQGGELRRVERRVPPRHVRAPDDRVPAVRRDLRPGERELYRDERRLPGGRRTAGRDRVPGGGRPVRRGGELRRIERRLPR